MTRPALLFFPLVIMLLFAGCAKKPAPEPVPFPMTEAYLLQHMRVKHDPERAAVSVTPPGILSPSRLADRNATLMSTFSATIVLDDRRQASRVVAPEYLLLFSVRAAAWGGFTSALDTLGERHNVVPYTSYIRNGIFYDNFYITLTRSWLETAAGTETGLLILGPKDEISVTIPPVYPRALLHYIDAGTFLPAGRTADVQTEKEDF